MRKLQAPAAAIAVAVAMLVAIPLSAQANHSWSTYHWSSSSIPVPLTVVDSMTDGSGGWDSNLNEAIADWDNPTGGYTDKLNLAKQQGSTSNKDRKRCSALAGKVRACNAAYGYNGWLGVAQIWISGGHIVQATAKMNDSYLASGYYDDDARQYVICQEIGHAWGLDHQSENGDDLGTCMDYDSALDNRAPNAHDYQQLQTIYGHTHQPTSSPKKRNGKNRNWRAFLNASVQGQENWGREVHASGKSSVYARSFGGGLKVYTHVTWASDQDGHHH